MILIDTDVAIDVLRGFPAAEAWAASQGEGLSLTGFSVMELVHGCADKKMLRQVDGFLSDVTIYWSREETCQAGLDLFRRFHLSHSLGMIDSLIAAFAITTDTTLHTFNRKHFGALPGLLIAQPYSK